jgi:hypothetical protein
METPIEPSGATTTVMAPCSSVRRTSAPAARQRSTTVGAGKPNRLARPQDTIAQRVPVWGSEYRDRKDRWAAVFHEFDGSSGKLSILDGGLDAAELAYVAAGVPDFTLKTVAPSVGYYRTAFLDFVLPGVIYIANHDPERDVGLLEYRNLELGFTAQISEGVADFVVTADDVLYTVPYGNAAGIWLLQAK